MISAVLSFLVYFPAFFGILIFLDVHRNQKVWICLKTWVCETRRMLYQNDIISSCKLNRQQDFWLPATGKRALSKSSLNLSRGFFMTNPDLRMLRHTDLWFTVSIAWLLFFKWIVKSFNLLCDTSIDNLNFLLH